jgi:DNA-binding CsgD family transcriptional regulator/alpha-D-ribose 1-methylphosphonate 5-triphosphate synthase subunit PhnG
MQRTIDEFHRRNGDHAHELPLVIGMAQAFCALLEEDHDLARHELDRVVASQDTNPTTYYLAGKHGVLPLLLSLTARIGDSDHQRFTELAATTAATMRWNRQFVDLGHAILLGRQGKTRDAAAVMAAAAHAARLYPRAWHLGLRLVAIPAHEDGWGQPALWLRQAEEYFHQADLPAIAAACRGALRRVGATAPQRRVNTTPVPARLREQGITPREYEVLELVLLRLSNQDIAARLHISPRTVEKHVANLLTKTNQTNRTSLSRSLSWSRTRSLALTCCLWRSLIGGLWLFGCCTGSWSRRCPGCRCWPEAQPPRTRRYSRCAVR